MIDTSSKFNTLRYACAEGKLFARKETLGLVHQKKVPKGDVFETARSAGIIAAKQTSQWIVFCHPIPLDWAEVSLNINDDHVLVTSEVKAIWKTGVEMEALTAVSAALLNIYDMLKPLDDTLRIGEVRLLKKKGGKTDFEDNITRKIQAAILVVSDSVYSGDRDDESGRYIKDFLQKHSLHVKDYDMVRDDTAQIQDRLVKWADDDKVDLIFTTGGTGPGPRDVTPEATGEVIDREVPGITETIRRHGKERTPYAMLSRAVCGVRKKSVIVNLPGSVKGAKEGLEALFPGLLHIFPMIWGEGHDEKSTE